MYGLDRCITRPKQGCFDRPWAFRMVYFLISSDVLYLQDIPEEQARFSLSRITETLQFGWILWLKFCSIHRCMPDTTNLLYHPCKILGTTSAVKETGTLQFVGLVIIRDRLHRFRLPFLFYDCRETSLVFTCFLVLSQRIYDRRGIDFSALDIMLKFYGHRP